MLDFILNHLFMIISFIILLFALPLIFRFTIKIALVLVAIAVIGSALYGPKFIDTLQDPLAVTQKFAQATIQPLVKSELENAKFSYNPETKQYVIQNNLFKLEGFSDQDKADLIIKGNKYSLKVTLLKSFIEKQIAQQSAQQKNII